MVDFERRGEYVLADVKSATWFFECGADFNMNKSTPYFFRIMVVGQWSVDVHQ
jgi:hypothetical protein